MWKLKQGIYPNYVKDVGYPLVLCQKFEEKSKAAIGKVEQCTGNEGKLKHACLDGSKIGVKPGAIRSRAYYLIQKNSWII